MSKLTDRHIAALRFIGQMGAIGPAPGWNASICLERNNEEVCDGADLAFLFDCGMLDAQPIPPPHIEQFDEDAGSITLDHEYIVTEAGRLALAESQRK